MSGATKGPLRLIVARPERMRETLPCGHTIDRVAGLGEDLHRPPKAKRRRCWKCGEAEALPAGASS